MSKLVVIQDDPVEGIDKHNVSGNAQPPPPAPYSGIGDFDYQGKMTDELSDFVQINGQSLALMTSKSALNPGEDIRPVGKHSGPQGKSFQPPSPPPLPETLMIMDPIGEGTPNLLSAGSNFVTVEGTAVLLDGDKIDTCDGTGSLGNSTVTANGQDFVSCSE